MCWFFMSYARADDQYRDAEYVRTFYEDLKSEVATKVKDQSGSMGFLDQANLKPGDPWPDDIARAVRTCRTFVPVMTARYFTREYCGKEWTIFEERCEPLRVNGKLPPLIIPVLWVSPVEGELPSYAMDLNVTFDPYEVSDEERDKLANYAKYGLLYVIKRKNSSYQEVYETILEQLARRIIEVAIQHPLKPLDSDHLPSLKDVKSRFHTDGSGMVPEVMASLPSNRAGFAFVAGVQGEMAGQRNNPQQYYGPNDPREWRPFAPDESDEIALIAQSVATEEKLICDWITVDQEIVKTLREAEKKNLATILIVDPWTARLAQYQNILNKFDENQFRNCAVLVVWHPNDSEQERNHLRVILQQQALSRRFTAKNDTFFRHKIEAYSQLKSEIARSLRDLEAILARFRSPARPVGGSQHTEPPVISASGGAA